MTLTPPQVIELANRLRNRRCNVYSESEEMFGEMVGGEIYGQLTTYAELSRCIKCERWVRADRLSAYTCDACWRKQIDGRPLDN